MALPHLWVDGVCVDDDSLEVLEVCVVLQRSHVQPSLFTQLRDARPVVVRERVVGQDGVSHLHASHSSSSSRSGSRSSSRRRRSNTSSGSSSGGSNQCTSSSSTRVIEHDALQTAATAVDPPHSSVGTFVSQQLHHTAQQVLSLAPCHQVWSQPIQAIAELLLKSS
jgi:hypothetical protein